MALDPVKNFAISRVATAPSPADSGTTLVVETGDGSLFPDPSASGEYNVVIYPNGEQPTSTNAEIVRVTARTSDTMTIEREQESTSARTIVEGDIVMLAITAKMVSDLSTAVTGVVTEDAEQTLTNKTLTAPALSSPTISGAWDGWISAGETWTYASADDPTFTFTVASDVTTKYSAGMKIKLTQGTVKYFIITAVSTYSGGNTTITVYGGTDYDLANSAISANAYSMMKSPQGFPMSPAKWTVSVTDTSSRTQTTPTSGTWYNIGSITISIPIGAWKVTYKVFALCGATGASDLGLQTALSTANNSSSDTGFHCQAYTGNLQYLGVTMSKNKDLTITSKTTYYLNTKGVNAGLNLLRNDNDQSPLFITATCAYL